jgi:phage terminase small subunit
MTFYISKRAKLIDLKPLFTIDLSQVKQYSNSNSIYLNKKAATALKKAENLLPDG